MDALFIWDETVAEVFNISDINMNYINISKQNNIAYIASINGDYHLNR